MGVATQCLRIGKVSNAKVQYWANVALKLSLPYFRVFRSHKYAYRINVKLGGVNVVPDPAHIAALSDSSLSTIVMGGLRIIRG